jgi:hypothetical protein
VSINKDLVAASSTPLVLAILAEGDSYGYAILQRVRELSGGEMEWTDGMLYPVLHRLEKAGLIDSRWETAETGSEAQVLPGDGRRSGAAGGGASSVEYGGRCAPEDLVGHGRVRTWIDVPTCVPQQS